MKKLKDFGLNSYEAKIWAALLSRGVSTAGELSDIANVPRSRSYDVLESLEKKGFIMLKVGKPIKYLAITPNEVVERVKKRIREESDDQVKLMEELRGSEILNELNLLHSQGIDLVNPSDLAGAIRGRSNILDHLETMINESKKSIILCTTEDGIIKKAEALGRSLKRAKSRGVNIRITAPLTSKTRQVLSQLGEFAEVRPAKEMNARFCIVDDKNIAFMLMNDDKVHPTYDTGVWVNTPAFGEALKQMFDKTWQGLKVAN
jgi:sugar-specific transcriptional regulator TrmB